MLIWRHQEVYGNRDEPNLDNNGNIIDFPDDNNESALFKFKQTGQTGKIGIKDTTGQA